MTLAPENVLTTEENASAYLNNVNTNLANAGVTDAKGDPAQFSALAASPMWLMALALGQNITEWQERLRNAYNALNIASCTDAQVENLATLAGIFKKTGSAPYVILTVTNSTTNNLTINSENCYATDAVTGRQWYAGQTYVLAVDETAQLAFYCYDRDVSVPANTVFTITSRNALFDDITAFNVGASRILEPPESIAQLRDRIILRKIKYDFISTAQDAIARLNGVSKCSIFFNPNQNVPIVLNGGLTLPARTAYIVIQGYDADQLIPRTFLSYAIVNTLKTPTALQGQLLVGTTEVTVYYEQCKTVMAYIAIKIKPLAGDVTYQQRIKDVLTPYSGTLAVGQNLTAQLVCEWLAGLTDIGTLYDAYVGTAENPTGDVTNIAAQELLQFEAVNISFVIAE